MRASSRSHPVSPPVAGGPLPREFYARSVCAVARSLLGHVLVHETREGMVAGRIVEVEAYGGESDPASHARHGRTARNASMYGEAGHAYVYLSHGLHVCFNVVTGTAGRAAAVLVRALEPRSGLSLMALRRRKPDPRRFTPGPGCVGEALALQRHHDGADLTRGPLWISRASLRTGFERVGCSARVGIRVGLERRWRFFLEYSDPPPRREIRREIHR